ncbi:MAG: peptide-methionine (S)-S-oxide reductase MsrA [Ferruginibacter sp.]
MIKNKFLSLIIILSVVAISCSNMKSEPTHSKQETTAEEVPKDLSKYSKAYFASGCFWCVESVFESVKGVKEVVSGYSGGKEANPTYEQVGSGSTGHAESIEVYYDSSEVSYPTLLKVYFGSQNPTQVNGQGPDHGKQYRSIIFYSNAAEKQEAENYISKLNASGEYKQAIAAEVTAFDKFWEAEAYHQNYIANNPKVSYVQFESIPRIKKFQNKYPELIKPGHKF